MISDKGGMLPCGNCFIAVAQDEFVAVEKFGSFTSTLRPGFAFTGLDCMGACIAFKSLTSRVQLLPVKVTSKTQDNTFLTLTVDVQMSVIPDQLQDAMYKMQNIDEQISSYVTDVARTRVPNITLDDVFEKQDELAADITSNLASQMLPYGWRIHKALIVKIDIDPGVVKSINEINRQKRLREASVMAAEADKIRTVKQAEAAADKAALQGQGIARQRAAIIDGLREAIGGGDGSKVSTDDLRQLLLTTQYFETLGYIGSRPTSKTYFMPKEDPNDMDAIIRSGLIQGQVGVEFMDAGAGVGNTGGLGAAPPQARAPKAAPKREAAQQRPPRSLAPQQMDMGPAHDFFNQPPPAQSYAQPAPVTTMQIQVPPGVSAGMMLQVQTPDGRVVQVVVPQGVQPGQLLQIQV